MSIETSGYKVFYKCRSRDWHTNVWYVRCKNCDHFTNPDDTMLAYQLVKCQYCDYEEVINWNYIVDKMNSRRAQA
jgi:hypothetical protein